MISKKLLLPIFLVLTVFLTVNFVSASTFLNVSASMKVQPGNNITLTGTITNSSASDTISGINVSASVTSGGSGFNITPSSGFFLFNISAPTTVGEYTVTVTTNESSPHTKNVTIRVGNTTGGSISYLNTFPPFANGTTFTVNLTLVNGSTAVGTYLPNVSVYKANGQIVSWTISNLSASTNSSGSILYNITIPASAAAGDYVIVADAGSIFSFFQVSSNLMTAVQTWDTNDAVTFDFGSSSTVAVVAKVRDTSGNPKTGATVTAIVTLPNDTVRNFTLSAHPTSAGVYNNTFSETSATGNYEVSVSANVGGTTVTSQTFFTVGSFVADLQTEKSFFFEWGGKGSFKPGQTAALDIIATNLTDSSTIQFSTCTGASVGLLDMAFVNGTSVNSTTGGTASFATSAFPGGTTVCRISFTAPSTSGTYKIVVNVTKGGSSVNATGFFQVSKIFLKVIPVFSLGGEDDFMSIVAPGDNITISLKAVNVSNGSSMPTSTIKNITVIKMIPLEFTSGASQIANVNYTATESSDPNTDPSVTIVTSSSLFGPVLAEIQANVSGEFVTGQAFFIQNYLMGFLQPEGITFGEQGGPGGGGEGGGFSPFTRCSGTVSFTGNVQDAKTATAAQGVSPIGFIQAREEESGKDVTPYLSIASSTSSNSNGQFTVNITFDNSAYSFSGFYFMALNSTYKGNTAGIPGGFQCKSLNMGFPQLKTIGSTQDFSWQVSPSSGVSLSLTNVSNMSGSPINNQSLLTITQVFNFNPASGSMQILIPNNPNGMSINFTAPAPSNQVLSNNATILLYPQNFTLAGVNLTKWPTGFLDVRPRVISNLGTDSGFGGFQVVPFDAFPFGFNFGSSVSGGSVQSYTIYARTNVSGSPFCTGNGTCNTVQNRTFMSNYVNGANNGNNTGFVVQIGRPWKGELTTVTDTNVTLLNDGWNSSANANFEVWQVNFTVPATMKKGGAQLTITINNSDNEQMDIPLFLSITKYNVVIPSEEVFGNQNILGWNVPSDSWSSAFFGPEYTQRNTTASGWNVSNITQTYGVNTSSGRVCFALRFNTTKYGMTEETVAYDTAGSPIKVMIIDRFTSGRYDTVILNTSTGVIKVLNTTLRNVSAISGSGGVYLTEVKNCGMALFVNTSASSITSGGSYVSNNFVSNKQVNTQFVLPYVVTLGSASSPTFQSGFNVTINGMGKQDDRGFGFDSKLTGANYTSSLANTNADGVAFVNVNVSASGRFIAFWKVNSSADSDSADFSSATMMEVKKFDTNGMAVAIQPLGRATLFYNNASDGGWGVFSGASYVYNGTITGNGTYYIVYNPTTNQSAVANSTTGPCGVTQNMGPINSSIMIPCFSYSAGISDLVMNTSAATNSNNNVSFFFYPDTSVGNPVTVTSGTQNITVSICARGFEIPTQKGVEGASVNLSVTDWTTFPSTTKYLTMYKAYDDSLVSVSNPALTSPAGCVALKVGPGQLGTWPSSSAGKPPVFIGGTITNSSDVENMYVTDVFRQ